RAYDAVADDQHGDRRTADDVGPWRPASRRARVQRIEPDVAVQRLDDAAFGNADHQDRLAVLGDAQTDDRAGVVERDEDVDRLARVAARIDEIRREIDEADAFGPPERRRD